jgi:hypothetical protein
VTQQPRQQTAPDLVAIAEGVWRLLDIQSINNKAGFALNFKPVKLNGQGSSEAMLTPIWFCR